MSTRDIVAKDLSEFELKIWDDLMIEIEYCRRQEMQSIRHLHETRKRSNRAMKKMESLWRLNVAAKHKAREKA